MSQRFAFSVAAIVMAAVSVGDYGVQKSWTGTSIYDEFALGQAYYPPDTQGAIGPNNFVEVTNSSIAVYDRLGNLQNRQQLSNLVGYGCGDSRIKYDAISNRYFITTTDFGSRYSIGVSNTSNPLDGFTFQTLNPRPAGSTYLSDFPTLGMTKDGLYAAIDLYANPSDYNPAMVNVISMKKADLVAGTFGASSWSQTYETGDRWTQGSSHAVDDVTNTWTSERMLATRWFDDSVIHSNDITLGGGGFVVTPQSDINVDPYTQPSGAPQLGSPTLVTTNDARLFNTPVYQLGKLWVVHNVNDALGNPVLKWYEIDNATDAVIDSGIIGGGSLAAYFGSIAVNEFGDVVIGFSGSNAGSYASAYAIHGKLDLGSGHVTFDSPMLLQDGFGANTSNRFGDYSATMMDPNDHHRFWTVQELGGPDNKWGTYIAEIGPNAVPEPATLSLLVFGAAILARRRRS